MKKIIPWLLLVCLLCGCVQPTDDPGQSSVPSTEEATVESTEPAEDTVVLEGVNAHAFRASIERPGVAVFDERTAAFLTTEYVTGDFSQKQTRVQVFDLYTDTMKTEALLDGTYTLIPYCAAAGHIAIVSGEDNTALVLNDELQEVLSFKADSPEGILTENMEYYYYTWGSGLYCLDIATGTTAEVSTEYDLLLDQVRGYDAGENIMLVSTYADPYTTDLCMGAIDLDTREYVLLYKDISNGNVGADGIFLEQLNIEEMHSDVYYGDWSDPRLQKLPAFLVNDLEYNTWHISGSDYICKVTYDAAQKVSVVDCQLFRMGETVSVCSLQEWLDGAKLNEIITLPDGKLLAMAATRRGYQTYLICPEMLAFVPVDVQAEQGPALVDTTVTEQNTLDTQQELPEELAYVRRMADALEQEHGITILLSNQCAVPAAGCELPITTTDAAQLLNEAELIESALKELENVLELYPEDFFRQFQNEAGERGLLVLLVEEISSDLDAVGVTYEMGEWYPIAVDITAWEIDSIYCHEIWHATEIRISDLNMSALDLAAWDACNPADFVYPGEATPDYIQDTRYTFFFGEPGEDVYFVDPYGKTNSREDRARLMEYVMCYDMYARSMLKHPAMREKLTILCEAIREVFDTSQWEDVYWERFL